MKSKPENEYVVAVCDNEARVYGPAEQINGHSQPRPLVSVRVLEALDFAENYEYPCGRSAA
jgi:hypothetical protein